MVYTQSGLEEHHQEFCRRKKKLSFRTHNAAEAGEKEESEMGDMKKKPRYLRILNLREHSR